MAEGASLFRLTLAECPLAKHTKSALHERKKNGVSFWQMGRVVQRFGGQHTELKLRVLSDYLTAYLLVMQKQDYFRLSYIDALAGTGWSRAGYREDERQTEWLSAAPPTKGSALRVFDIKNSGRQFDRYVFNDRRRSALRQLQIEILSLFPTVDTGPQIIFSSDYADALIARECDRLKSHDRVVMFLDPFGMQVSWKSIERIAETNQIDLWYLAPIGGAYGRLMELNDRTSALRRRLLDEALGGSGWHEAIYKTSPPDMLGHSLSVRVSGWEAIATYFMNKRRSLFGPGALEATLPLGHPGRLPFMLCFACANRNPAAYQPALKIAGHLIEEARSGRLL